MPVEPTRSQQCGIEDVRPVGGRDHDHIRAAVEPVHLDQDLIQRLLALIVAAAETRTALTTDRVDLIHEDDARRGPLGLVEEIANPARADADEHLDEFRAGNAEERHAGLARDRARQQCLARAGRSNQQHTARNAGAERLKFLGVFEELDDLDKLFLGFVNPGHIRERHCRPVAREQTGATLAEGHGLAVAALGLAHHENEDAYQEQRR